MLTPSDSSAFSPAELRCAVCRLQLILVGNNALTLWAQAFDSRFALPRESGIAVSAWTLFIELHWLSLCLVCCFLLP